MPNLLNTIAIVNGQLVQLDDMLIKYAMVSSTVQTPTPVPPTPIPDPPEPTPDPPVDPFNPLGLPSFTIRCKFDAGYIPEMGDSQTLVDESENVWDITNNNTKWGGVQGLFTSNVYLLEVLGANTTGVTNMQNTFRGCSSLQSVALFDMRDCENLNATFQNCSNLNAIPLFSTNSCTQMNSTFRYCTNVTYGALALYQQASSQSTEVTAHNMTFTDCGSGTVSGLVELEQIPYDWK